MSSDAKIKRPSNKRQLKQLLKESGELELSASDRLVMAIVYTFSDLKGWAWPKQETISALSALSVKTVRKSLKKLGAVGLIHSLKRKPAHGFGRIASIDDSRKETIKKGADLLLIWPIASNDAKEDAIGHREDAVFVPRPEAQEWIIINGGEEWKSSSRGPYSLDQLGALAKSKKLPPNATVRTEADTTPNIVSRIPAIARYYPRLAA